jgi:hypothetical protein
MTGVGSLPPNEVHDLVLSFARNTGIGDVYLQLRQRKESVNGLFEHLPATYVLPPWIRINFLYDPISERFSEEIHEWRSWSDCIRVP